MVYISGIYDTDLKILDFLSIVDILKFRLINTSANALVIRSDQYVKFIIAKMNIADNRLANIFLRKCYALGLINILKIYYKNGVRFIVDECIDIAARFGHINILEWFRNSDFQFQYTANAIDYAAMNGHLNVLKWFKISGLEFKYIWAIIFAASHGHINVLEWFHRSGFEFRYTQQAIFGAVCYCRINVLEWFQKSGYDLYYEPSIINLIKNNLSESDIQKYFPKIINVFLIQ